jgi:hypothetical protein
VVASGTQTACGALACSASDALFASLLGVSSQATAPGRGAARKGARPDHQRDTFSVWMRWLATPTAPQGAPAGKRRVIMAVGVTSSATTADEHRQCFVVEPTALGERGHGYRVTYTGAVLVDGSRNPEFDACRALLARGIRGKLEVWRKGATFPATVLDIEAGARLTVAETDAAGPRFMRWQPFSADASPDAVFRVHVAA